VRILTVVGARPQFIKAAPVSYAIAASRGSLEEIVVHTGQHFDTSMSEIFFNELGIPAPQYHLGIHGGSHGEMTGRMLAAVEGVVLESKPEVVLVYGDTNSTLAGALAAAKLHVPVAHVEAGLRSFNRRMPEEINRVLTDHVSELLFCPTAASVTNLAREGIVCGVHQLGDVMYDATLMMSGLANSRSRILDQLGLTPKSYALATVHRAENTDDPQRLAAVLEYLREVAREMPVVFPLHPRTRVAAGYAEGVLVGLTTTPPLGYLDMLRLTAAAALVLTDSGGLQKEAYFHRVPCVTLRDETEWVETVACGWNRLWTHGEYAPRREIADYGTGDAASRIVAVLGSYLRRAGAPKAADELGLRAARRS
jgi:UDP-GlcNAc3NAcA epimerase